MTGAELFLGGVAGLSAMVFVTLGYAILDDIRRGHWGMVLFTFLAVGLGVCVVAGALMLYGAVTA